MGAKTFYSTPKNGEEFHSLLKINENIIAPKTFLTPFYISNLATGRFQPNVTAVGNFSLTGHTEVIDQGDTHIHVFREAFSNEPNREMAMDSVGG